MRNVTRLQSPGCGSANRRRVSLSKTTNAALETRLVRTQGTGKIFTALVLREKHIERPRDFAHLTDSKAISRLAKACHVWPRVPPSIPGRNRAGGIYAIPYCTKPGRTLCCMLQEWPPGTPVPERILSPRSAPNPDTSHLRARIASVSDAAFSLEVSQGQSARPSHS